MDDLKVLKQKIRSVNILIFDLDGTLVDTDYANYLSYKRAIRQVIRSQLYLTFNPKKRITREVIRIIIPDLSEGDYKNIIKIKEKVYPDYLNETRLNIKVAKILDEFSNKELILLTNSRKERAAILLKWHQIFDRFNLSFYREDIGPNINKFQYVLSILKISGISVAVFENDESEIDKAISVGIPSENIFMEV